MVIAGAYKINETIRFCHIMWKGVVLVFLFVGFPMSICLLLQKGQTNSFSSEKPDR